METVGRLRQARQSKGLSQEALEELTGVHQVSISKLEKRGPTKAILSAILVARALNTTVEALFGNCVEKPRKRRKPSVRHAQAA